MGEGERVEVLPRHGDDAEAAQSVEQEPHLFWS